MPAPGARHGFTLSSNGGKKKKKKKKREAEKESSKFVFDTRHEYNTIITK